MVSLKKADGMLIFFFQFGSLKEAQCGGGGSREYINFYTFTHVETTLFIIGTVYSQNIIIDVLNFDLTKRTLHCK